LARDDAEALKISARVVVPKRRPSLIMAQAFGTPGNPGPLMLKVRGRCFDSALKMAQELRDSIYKQKLRHFPLSPKYLRWKIRKGLDPRILISTKKYIKAIGVQKTKFGALIGLTKTMRYDTVRTRQGVKIRQLSYALLAKWLEYGTRQRPVTMIGPRGGKHRVKVTLKGGMPPRPHWRPSIKKWKEGAKHLRRELRKEMSEDLRKMFREARA
jgi:hypothetical protein